MNEQTMKILPAYKKPVVVNHGENNRIKDKAFCRGYNAGVDDCAAAIEKANLVRCPTEKEILNCISAVCQCSSCVTCRESAKAIIALLRGEK